MNITDYEISCRPLLTVRSRPGRLRTIAEIRNWRSGANINCIAAQALIPRIHKLESARDTRTIFLNCAPAFQLRRRPCLPCYFGCDLSTNSKNNEFCDGHWRRSGTVPVKANIAPRRHRRCHHFGERCPPQ